MVQPALYFEPGPFPGLPGPAVGPKGPKIGQKPGAGFIILSSLGSAQPEGEGCLAGIQRVRSASLPSPGIGCPLRRMSSH